MIIRLNYSVKVIVLLIAAVFISVCKEATFAADDGSSAFLICEKNTIKKNKYMNQGRGLKKIAKRWQIINANTITESVYKVNPKLSPGFARNIQEGALKNSVTENALKIVNYARFLTGLSKVKLSSKYNESCQIGAYVLQMYGKASHTPENLHGIPKKVFKVGYNACSASNIYYYSGATDGLLRESVLGYLQDSDKRNISAVGHRRRILNPLMGKTGFGNVGGYCLMYALDTSGSSINRKGYVLWPSSGYFPLEMFANISADTGQVWSVMLDYSKFSYFKIKGIKVGITNKVTGAKEILNYRDKGRAGEGYFSVNNDDYGGGFAVVFRGRSSVISEGDRYRIKITGLRDKNKNKKKITYDVCFVRAGNI